MKPLFDVGDDTDMDTDTCLFITLPPLEDESERSAGMNSESIPT